MTAASPHSIVTAILAGGHGRRFGGTVKATLSVGGRTLLQRVHSLLAQQSHVTVLCVAPQHVDADWVQQANLPIAVDAVTDAGPLAAVAAALLWVRTHALDAQAIVTVPVDVPFVPLDLITRLRAAATIDGLAVAESGTRRHHAVALWPISAADELNTAVLDGTANAVHRWQATRPVAAVHWQADPYDPFFNINTADDLRTAERIAVLADAPQRTRA